MNGLDTLENLVDTLEQQNDDNLADQEAIDNDLAAERRGDIEQERDIANADVAVNDLKEQLFTVSS